MAQRASCAALRDAVRARLRLWMRRRGACRAGGMGCIMLGRLDTALFSTSTNSKEPVMAGAVQHAGLVRGACQRLV